MKGESAIDVKEEEKEELKKILKKKIGEIFFPFKWPEAKV